MKYIIGGLAVAGLLLTQNAEASCEGMELSAKDAAVRLSTLNSYFVKKDYERVKVKAKELEELLPCMRTPAPPQVFATAYRYVGVGYFLNNDEENAKRWFRTSFELNPNHHWGVNEVKTSDPLYKIYEGERGQGQVDLVAIEGMDLTPPEGTYVYVDGRIWKEAALTPDRPHIVFIASASDRHIISRFTIDGTSMPDMLLAKEDPKKKKKQAKEGSEADMFAVQQVKRVRPPSKTPLLISSVVTMAAAGGVYGYTYTTNSDFYAATTTVDKDALRKKNNSLIVTSIAVGTLGLGVGYVGVIIDAPTYSLGIPWQL